MAGHIVRGKRGMETWLRVLLPVCALQAAFGSDNGPTPTPCPFVGPCVKAVTLEVDCLSPPVDSGATLDFILAAPFAAPPSSCEPTACDPILTCRIPCGLIQAPTCPFPGQILAGLLIDCLNAEGSGNVCVTAEGTSTRLRIKANFDFECCIDSEEFDLAPGLALPLTPGCSWGNLCDGTPGNGGGGESVWTGGLAISCEAGPCPEPTVTQTEPPSETPTPSATQEEGATPTPTATQPGGPTPTPTGAFKPLGCDIGFYMLDSFGGRHRVGNPETIDGPLFFGTDLARDMELVSLAEFSGSPSRGFDLVVLDAFGAAHYVAHDVTIPQDFVFPADPEFPEGRAVDIETAFDGLGFWVLTDFGGIYRAGSTKDPGDPGLVPGTDRMGTLGFDVAYGSLRAPTLPNPGGASLHAVALAVIDTNSDSRAEGYSLIDSQGGRYQMLPNGNPVPPNAFLGEPLNSPLKLLDPAAYAWPFFPGLDIARDCELHPSGQGVVILDGWGGIHPVPVDGVSNPVFFANNRNPDAPDTLLSTVGLPYITGGFDDPSTPLDESNESIFGRDAASIFKDLEFCRDGRSGMSVMDRFGGVFAFGEARGEPDNLAAPFEGIPFFFPHLYAEDLETLSPAQAEHGALEGGGVRGDCGPGGGGSLRHTR